MPAIINYEELYVNPNILLTFVLELTFQHTFKYEISDGRMNLLGVRIRVDWIMERALVFLDLRHFPKKRTIDEFVSRIYGAIGIIHFLHRFSSFLVDIDTWRTSQLLVRGVCSDSQSHTHHSTHNIHRC